MASWINYVESMSNWFKTNIHTYQGHQRGMKLPINIGIRIPCPLLDNGKGKVRDDCSGFVSACLQYAGIFPTGVVASSIGFVNTTGVFANYLKTGGFVPMVFNRSSLQPGDIYAVNNGAQHHVEIYAGKQNGRDMTYSWGNVHDTANGGMPSTYASLNYSIMWRHDGTTLTGNLINQYVYDVPREKQEDNILLNELMSIKINLLQEILEGSGVIFCENKDAYTVEDILYKEAINKNYIFHNKLLTKNNVNSVKFSNIAPVIYKYEKDNETFDKSISEISVDILNNTSFDSISNEFPSEFSTPDDE